MYNTTVSHPNGDNCFENFYTLITKCDNEQHNASPSQVFFGWNKPAIKQDMKSQDIIECCLKIYLLYMWYGNLYCID